VNPLSMVVTVGGLKARLYTERDVVAFCWALGLFEKQPDQIEWMKAA
jgi:hypothetical protein